MRPKTESSTLPSDCKRDYILFWGGIYSQWYACNFEIDGIKYNCTEQYMMAQKANLFEDDDAHRRIMGTNSPKIQKIIGRHVKNFVAKDWETVCRTIVEQGNYAKFSQNPELKSQLLDTKDREIVEASPYDTIWGIGLGANDPKALDKSQWRGKNWLGDCLMKVRETLRKES